MMRHARYWTVIGLLLLATVVLYRRGDKDLVPASTPLDEFPHTILSWTGVDQPISEETREILGQGIFLSRNYTAAPTMAMTVESSGPVGLFIGYFPTQRTGQSIHSPQNCLPGSGWTFESSGTARIRGSNGRETEVGDYVIVNGVNRAEVLYWYQSHGRAIANDYKAKLYMVADSIRYQRSDAALVRVVTPLGRNESRAQAHQRAVRFAEQVTPLLPAYIPN